MLHLKTTVGLEAACPGCRGPLTTLLIMSHKEQLPHVGQVRLCVTCVVRLLCRATIALHGDIGEAPDSSKHPGHEARLAAHERRIWDAPEMTGRKPIPAIASRISSASFRERICCS